MALNQLLEADTQLLLYCAWPVNMPTDAIELGPMVVLAPKLREPLRPSAKNGGSDCHRFYVGDS